MRTTEPGAGSDADRGPLQRQRLDTWLWFARFARTRSLAAKLIADGHVRLNGAHVRTCSRSVRRGDVLTLSLARSVVVLTVADLAPRRGPSSEAVRLYSPHDDSAQRG